MAEFFGVTDPGRRRENNQDSVLVRELPAGYVLLVVADGVGGMRGGEVASSSAIEGLVDDLLREPIEEPAERLARAYEAANRRVVEIAGERPELKGMASTMVTALVREDGAVFGNVGDSRAYLVDADGIRQISSDHSWVAEQVRAGSLTPDEAERHQFRSVITRAMGADAGVEPDIEDGVRLVDGATIVLCSDGLYRVVSDDEIARTVASGSVEQCARRLVEMANAAGGPDNIGIAILRHGQFSDTAPTVIV